MIGLRKRIACIVLALVLAIVPLSRPLPVRAAAIPIAGAELSEALMVLLDLLINAMIVGGAVEYAANYDSDMDLLDAFMQYISPSSHITFYMQDGSTVSLADLQNAWDKGTITMPDWWVDEWDVDDETGEDVVQLPNEQLWGKYRVGFNDDFASILEAWGQRGGGTGQEPEDPKDPEFSKLDSIAITSGFIATIRDFISDLWEGKLKVTPEVYFEKAYTGTPRTDGVVYLYDMQYTNINGKEYSVTDYKSSYILYGVTSLNNNYNPPRNQLYIYRSIGGSVAPCAGYTGGSNAPLYYYKGVIDTDIPIFSSSAAAKAYFATGDTTGLLNGLTYDFPALIKNIPAALSSLTNVKLQPAALQKVYAATKTAYKTKVQPEVQTDPQTNSETYNQTMTDTVTDTVTELAPAPLPDTGTDTDTDTDTTTDVDVKKYKRDLRMVFPFCLPFDLIDLLDALDADPVTPSFKMPFVVPALDINMSVDLDLSFLDDVAAMIRLFETIGFIITLIMATSKLIKW